MTLIALCWLMVLAQISTQSSVDEDPNVVSIDVQMPNIHQNKAYAWKCHSQKIQTPQPLYIVGVDLLANFDSPLHHISVIACAEPKEHKSFWTCYAGNECKDSAAVIWGWSAYGVDITKWRYPDDVGIEIGGRSQLQYIVIQVHYAGPIQGGATDNSGMRIFLTPTPKPYSAGFFVTAIVGSVPGWQTDYGADCACAWTSDEEVEVIGYSVHSHKAATLIEGFHVRGDKWTLIGRMTPVVQANIKSATPNVVFRKGDILASRCHLRNASPRPLTFGVTNQDEMCNFEVMFKYRRLPGNQQLRLQTCSTTMPEFHINNFPTLDEKSHPVRGLINL